MTDDTLDENAATVVVVEAGTAVVEVVESCVVVADERAAGGLRWQLARRAAKTIEPRPSANCLRTAVFSRKSRAASLAEQASRCNGCPGPE